jgi:hypothetical protein
MDLNHLALKSTVHLETAGKRDGCVPFSNAAFQRLMMRNIA